MKIAIIGLGYVGLPLAVAFAKKRDVIGFDISKRRVKELKQFHDSTLEVSSDEMQIAENLEFTTKVNDLQDCNTFIVTVPTPIDKFKKPNLSHIIEATKSIAPMLKKNDIVIYESTVYPGTTEEVCVPTLEKYSNLKFNKDFFCGYSPERINPGDKEHRIENIQKITSGSTPLAAEKIDSLYKEIIIAGTHLAESIKVAEAAKVIENTQRDVNIALVNEFSLIFNKLQIDTEAVLKAAETKWNFLSFRPGLVGGHCIGVDPYYLTYKSIEAGYTPEMILAGRKLNDNMGSYIVDQVSQLMANKGISIVNSNILIMGLSFKENCPDLRNTKVEDLIYGFKDLNANIDIFDPWVDQETVKKDYDLALTTSFINLSVNHYDALVLAVAHDEIKALGLKELISLCKSKHVIYDIKHLLKSNESDGRL
jgi:UDP-N-acetyl-D-glucosamine/UDP-N-acetyl-D-galactosamine dehydrogenase